MQSESAYARPLPLALTSSRRDPLVYPKGNPRYGSIETAGCSGMQQKIRTNTRVHAMDMPLHANHNRNAMGKRAAVFGHEIGDWRLVIGGLGDWWIGAEQKLQLQPETGNALASLAALRATCERTGYLFFRSICAFLSLSLSIFLSAHTD